MFQSLSFWHALAGLVGLPVENDDWYKITIEHLILEYNRKKVSTSIDDDVHSFCKHIINTKCSRSDSTLSNIGLSLKNTAHRNVIKFISVNHKCIFLFVKACSNGKGYILTDYITGLTVNEKEDIPQYYIFVSVCEYVYDALTSRFDPCVIYGSQIAEHRDVINPVIKRFLFSNRDKVIIICICLYKYPDITHVDFY